MDKLKQHTPASAVEKVIKFIYTKSVKIVTKLFIIHEEAIIVDCGSVFLLFTQILGAREFSENLGGNVPIFLRGIK